MNEEVYALWFNNCPQLGLRQKYKLFLHFKSFERLYLSEWKELSPLIHGVSRNKEVLTKEIFDRYKEKLSEFAKQCAFLENQSVKILHPNHNDFPELLKDLVDCPLNIFAKGMQPFPEFAIGIVGSRRCSPYGKKIASYMAYELSRAGVNIVSGLAYGIDVAAHQGALQGNGFTTAVLGGGLHACYPTAHTKIFEEIQKTGCVISEEPFGTVTQPYMFPKRNRLISGMSQGILVVEAAEKSGSLITVDFALEQGREVFTVPNRLFEKVAVGTNNLIKQGAKIVFHPDDILSEIVYLSKLSIHDSANIPMDMEKKLDEKEKIVYSCISYDPSYEETIISDVLHYKTMNEDQIACQEFDKNNLDCIASIDTAEIQLCLVNLEIKGFIKKISSCYYARSEV